MYGRRVIYSSETEVTDGNVLSVLSDAMRDHGQNAADIDYLYMYYRGFQPILQRTKTIRPEICNKIVENHALEIVDFKKGYVFGEPIQYVRKGEGDGVSEKIGQLNSLMGEIDKATFDSELGEWMLIAGTCYRMVLPGDGDEPLMMDVCDPRYSFVVYNNSVGRKPIMGCTFVTRKDKTVQYAIYTPTRYYLVQGDKIIDRGSNALGMIPIIEYPANNSRLGAFEVVLGLMDTLNNSASNRMDGIEQFVQSFIKFINCDIDEETFVGLKDLGALKIRSDGANQADVEIISNELDQSQVQVLIDHTYQMMLTICGMPDRNGSAKTTGDTGQAVMLRDGWSAAEARAKDIELMFRKSERQFLKLVLRILKDTKGYELDLKITDIEVKFTRNKSDSLITKSQGLQNLLEAGIHPEVAIKTVSLFSDPEQVYLDSMKHLEKWENVAATVTPGNNKPGEPDVD